MAGDAETVRILLLEDSPADAELVAAQLERAGRLQRIERVDTRAAFVAALAAGGHDLILADFALPGFDGMAALQIAHAQAPDIPFIFVSGVLGEETAVEALKQGATDYVVKQRLAQVPAAVDRALKEAEDRRERRKAEERSRMLVAELSHRVKNTLATVMAIAQQTLKLSGSLPEFEQAFTRRIEALADAHALLFRTNWGDTDLRDVVDVALTPFRRGDGHAVHIEGEAVMLPPRQALTMTLIVHELATNAGKYGALSDGNGRVRIRWRADGDGSDGAVLRFRWEETAGPPVSPPSRAGFGSRLIERSVSYELDGEANLSFPPAGAVCELSFPIGAWQSEG
ncbi:MAG: sensor histidine kinase [Rhodospirillales bacterium]